MARALSNRQQWIDVLTELNPPHNHIALRRTSLGGDHGGVGSELFGRAHDDDIAEHDLECPDTPMADDDGGIPTQRLPSCGAPPVRVAVVQGDSAADGAIDLATPLGAKPLAAHARARWMLKKRALDRLDAS